MSSSPISGRPITLHHIWAVIGTRIEPVRRKRYDTRNPKSVVYDNCTTGESKRWFGYSYLLIFGGKEGQDTRVAMAAYFAAARVRP